MSAPTKPKSERPKLAKASAPCPTCKGPVPPRDEAAAYPFCCERCRMADLGTWLDEGYAIPGEPRPEFDD